MFRSFLLDAWNSYINSETSIQFFMKSDWITCVSSFYLLPIFSLCTSSKKTSLSIKRCMIIPSRKGNHVRNTSSMHFLIGVQERWKVITFKLHRFWEGSRIFSTLSYPGWTSVSSRVTQSKTLPPMDNLYEEDATIRDNAISWFAVFRASLRIFFVHAPR